MKFLFTLSLLTSLLTTHLFSFEIERRKDQNNYNSGYIFVPAPYSVPGIGDGVFFLAMASNINGTQTDFIADIITGDVSGYGIGVMDYYPNQNEYFKLDVFQEGLKEATFQSYSKRGMDSSKDDYVLMGIDKLEFTVLRGTLEFYEKMLSFYFTGYHNSFSLNSLKDEDGTVIINSTGKVEDSFKSYSMGLLVDYTDDQRDPRVGLRFDINADYSPNQHSYDPNFYVMNYNLTGYIPIGKQSTWAFNYFQSHAHMIKEGDRDYNSVKQRLGLDCDLLTDQKEKNQCISVINNTIDANIYGTSTSLGGRTRLRSYPESRFSGAHTQFYGTELRWNFTDESTPFDIWFMKDIRTNVQGALFYERGSVADHIEDLGKMEKESYGLGLRMVTGSGLVYRLDVGWGDEDYAVTVIINYPWENF